MSFVSLSNRAILALFGLVLLAGPAHAQEVEQYTLDPESKLWIDGTSTRSDWTVYADDIEGQFGLAGNGAELDVEQAQFAVRATEIESRKSTIMDRLIDDALMVEEHPVIRYQLTSAEAGSAANTFDTVGELTLGGQTNEVAMTVTAAALDGGKVRFTGAYPMKMSDYGLKAPVAMFGALRTGDEVTVNFDLVVVREP